MKMTPEDYRELKDAIAGEFPFEGKTLAEWQAGYVGAGLTPTRFRWDLLHRLPVSWSGRLYVYLDDTHIDTALRHIVDELTGATK